jgi:Na+-transporting NADH:ubiquinone oxidoreductase subunit NqrB
MEFFSHLWLPIVLATVAMFIASALLWTAGPHHKKEHGGVPDEDALIAVLRKANLQPGVYAFPFVAPEMRGDKAKAETWGKKWAEGPAGMLTIVPKGPMNMGKMMGQSIVFYLVVNIFLGALGAHAIRFDGHATFRHVYGIIGLATFMSYFFATTSLCIWFGRPWKSQWLQIVDGLIYAAATGAIFAWLWPR